MSLRLNGSTSGYSELEAPAVAGDQTFTLPGTGGTLDRLNRQWNVLQIVSATYSTETTTSSGVDVDTGLQASITPSSTSSKVLIFVSQTGLTKSAANAQMALTLRNAAGTYLLQMERQAVYTASSSVITTASSGLYLDSPNSTSSVTYRTSFRNDGGVGTVRAQASSSASSMVLMEVAG
jgi:hypothetical protein